MKKFMSFVLALLMVMSLAACGSKATPEGATKQDGQLIYDGVDAFEYDEVDDGIIIVDFKNYDYIEYDKIYVPREIGGQKVVGIGSTEEAHIIMGAIFGKCEVVIPDTVTYIAGRAFEGADGLVKLSGGENCTSIGEHAFRNCENLQEVTFIDHVTDLADNAFGGCTAWEANH